VADEVKRDMASAATAVTELAQWMSSNKRCKRIAKCFITHMQPIANQKLCFQPAPAMMLAVKQRNLGA